jgi:beta-aspartyl-peptidase (threonine type)
MPDLGRGWSLIAHGGAKEIDPGDEQANRNGIEQAIRIGSDILDKGGAALDAVVEVVKSFERDPTFNAGLYGSVRNEDGEMEMDASIMDGATLDIGAFAGVKDIEHPVMLAKALLREKAIFLVGDGVVKFAREKGLPSAAQPEPLKHSVGCDTVGCVARDFKGNLAVATSTGGLEGCKVGRVGDVPLPGCGFYADNKRGAVSASGEGESIARVMLSSELIFLLRELPADEAAKQALEHLKRVNGEAGLIVIGPDGNTGWAHNSPHFAVGIAQQGETKSRIFLRKEEEHA